MCTIIIETGQMQDQSGFSQTLQGSHPELAQCEVWASEESGARSEEPPASGSQEPVMGTQSCCKNVKLTAAKESWSVCIMTLAKFLLPLGQQENKRVHALTSVLVALVMLGQGQFFVSPMQTTAGKATTDQMMSLAK